MSPERTEGLRLWYFKGFSSRANPILRIAVAALVPLFVLHYLENPLPMLVSVFAVIMLTLMPGRPSLQVLSKLSMVVVAAAMVQHAAGILLSGTGTGSWMFLFAVLFYSLSRIHLNPKDIVGTMMMILGIMVTILHWQFATTVSDLPLVLAANFVGAIVMVYLVFWLFPGEELGAEADTAWEVTPSHWLKIVVKSLFLLLVIFLLIDSDNSQSLLIAITLANLIKDPNPMAGTHNGRQRLWTTAVGVLLTLPLLLAFWLDMHWWLLMLFAIALALWGSATALEHRVSMAEYQLLMSSFVMLVYQVISHDGTSSLTSSLTRFGAVVLAVLLGVMMLGMLSELGVTRTGSRVAKPSNVGQD
ncbi:DUF2955 domain-containing protein [Shewanella amazonensis]|uniref:Permease of the major facilitator superfamily n=1 Tax=Shewanella amazonensis (strain ATCC BAA-1098 / SB2B) TaxID=326297 RepID=A1S4A2_SHEAM|nr:DUF2955 domain-containing protein [Shewanella amazonensis]ABL99208.1 permease of the major facilitator superfamily [Shewanella amazonensis SB2B]